MPNRGQKHPPVGDIRSRVMCPGGVGFATRSASGGCGAVLVANLTRAVIDGVSVRVIGNGLGLQFSKPDDKHGKANWEFSSARWSYGFTKKNFCILLVSKTLRVLNRCSIPMLPVDFFWKVSRGFS